jgi:hypothetical protein
MRYLPLIFILAGCATNGVTVHEKTAEGYEFSMTQKTMSTWGSRTEEGAGSVDYEGTDPSGSSFKLRAGAAVKGQQAGDPSGLILGVFQAIMPVLSKGMDDGGEVNDPEVQVAVDAEKLSEAMDLIERMIEQQDTILKTHNK